MEHLRIAYGEVRSGESLLQEFYNATKSEKESTPAWHIRVQDLLTRARQADTTTLPEELVGRKIREHFFKGLRHDWLKDNLRHSFDSGDPMTVLLQRARQIEGCWAWLQPPLPPQSDRATSQ